VSVGVIGSGFGAYGYMPALIEEGNSVISLKRYIPKIISRPELQKYVGEIRFIEEISELFHLSEKIVIAVPPAVQSQIISHNKLAGKKLFLEKPLGISLLEHSNVLKKLITDKIDFRLAYLFMYTEWIQLIPETNYDDLEIFWSFPWPETGWKSELVNNSGAAVYYGIHFYPIFWKLGVLAKNVKTNEKYGGLSIESSQPRITISILNSTQNSFEIVQTQGNRKQSLFKSVSPFGDIPRKNQLDPRIDFLRKYLSDRSETATTKKSLEIENYVRDCRFTPLNNLAQN